MKSIKTILLVLALMMTVSASAQFRFGPRIGTEINSMKFDESAFSNENRAGFTGGLMCEFTVPIVNIGFDLSVMYVHRVSQSIPQGNNAENNALATSSRFKTATT